MAETWIRAVRGFPPKPGPWHLRGVGQRWWEHEAVCGTYITRGIRSTRDERPGPDDGRLCRKCERESNTFGDSGGERG